MSVYKIILLAWFAFGAIMSVALIGKDRKPTTPSQVAIQLVLIAGVCTLVVLA
jgi:hypothetical protein